MMMDKHPDLMMDPMWSTVTVVNDHVVHVLGDVADSVMTQGVTSREMYDCACVNHAV